MTPPLTPAEYRSLLQAIAAANGAERDVADEPEDDESDTDLSPVEVIEG